ncbi:DUF1214 domain-containing protein [Nocardioides mangrovi]|uniref:DUF1214 domain-containing protein n=1 Tax=Nocardioides mangrovi TaxID=2874580 RepID=A0ABS7UDG5_9ACTN|nr:DUF1214 domain-containing protein [Nocardioides mangrovi]MBZ5739038.1 DUF1214 domain-containing protein [Nocardioides mangrovi]
MTPDVTTATASDRAWDGLLGMLGDLTAVVREDAADDRERREGYRVLGRVLALCSELTLDVDPEVPRFFPMTTAMRQVGGPNPDGEYDLASIQPGRGYRITGERGTVTYLGFQVMAGTGLSPRRQAAYVSDRDLVVGPDGRFTLVLAPSDPGTGEPWAAIPEDASAIVVRQYVADRGAERLATYDVQQLVPSAPLAPATDEEVADQLTALTWTAFKLMTLHRSILPELVTEPNRLVTAEAAAIGSENTTPDNLYMLGSFDLGPDDAWVLDVRPPDTRYWSVTLENIWHECLEPARTASSGTQVRFSPRPDGTVRLVVAGRDPGVPNWLDTGGRRRGFLVLRWLGNPAPPAVEARVVPIPEVSS